MNIIVETYLFAAVAYAIGLTLGFITAGIVVALRGQDKNESKKHSTVELVVAIAIIVLLVICLSFLWPFVTFIAIIKVAGVIVDRVSEMLIGRNE